MESAVAARAKHAEVTRGQSGHKEGPPDGYAFVAILVAISESPTCQPHETNAIAQFLSDHPPKSEALMRYVLCCRVQDAYSKEYKKVYLKLAPECKNLEDPVQSAIKRMGGEQFFGQAPRGSLERRAQELLTALDPASASGR